MKKEEQPHLSRYVTYSSVRNLLKEPAKSLTGLPVEIIVWEVEPRPEESFLVTMVMETRWYAPKSSPDEIKAEFEAQFSHLCKALKPVNPVKIFHLETVDLRPKIVAQWLCKINQDKIAYLVTKKIGSEEIALVPATNGIDSYVAFDTREAAEDFVSKAGESKNLLSVTKVRIQSLTL